MSDLDRRGLKLIAESLGRANQALTLPLGDTDLNPAALNQLEVALCRLRGSTLFHDSDYAANYLHFGSSDPVGLGIQGAALISPSHRSLPFPPQPQNAPWSPQYGGAPCPEGWAVTAYNGWAGYQPTPLTLGSEPNGGAARLNYPYPVRYASSSYSRVPFFDRARFISIRNSGSATLRPGSVAVFNLTSDDLEGVRRQDAATGRPLDVAVYTYATLTQDGPPHAWGDTSLFPSQGTAMEQCAYRLTVGAAQGSWDLAINVPSDVTGWAVGYYWHVVFYWGSLDNLPAPPTFAASTAGTTAAILWPRRSFFGNAVTDGIGWDLRGINDQTPYLVARHRTHFGLTDGQFTQPSIPTKYVLPTQFPQATTGGAAGSFAGYAAPRVGSAVPVILTALTQGSGYASPQAQVQVVVGPEVTPEFFLADWRDCPYFPPAPEGQVVLARAVLVRAPSHVFGNVVANAYSFNPISQYFAAQSVLAGISIAWFERSVKTHAQPPLSDAFLTQALLPALQSCTSRFRTLGANAGLLDVSFSLIAAGARLPSSLAPTRASLSPATGRPATIFHALLKQPVNIALIQRPFGEPLAIPFTPTARALITEIGGIPPSTELMRLDADHLSMTGQHIGIPSTLELYVEPSDACERIDLANAGNRLGQDYTFRFALEDGDGNILTKDLYVMASKFYLSPQEFAQQALQGSTIGYYTTDSISGITEFRLQGYAGFIPDLAQGTSRPILTRVVSPNDATKITQAQFVAQRQGSGELPAQVNEDVLRYLEGGGEFYTVDLSQYSNQFVSLRSVAVSVTKYAFESAHYWGINMSNYFGYGQNSDPNTLFADSFTLATSGLSAGTLEQFGSQAAALFSRTAATGSDFTLLATGPQGAPGQQALGFTLYSGGSMAEIGLRLKMAPTTGNASGLLTNPTGFLGASLYADNGGSPGALLASGGSIAYGVLTQTYAEYRFRLQANVTAGVAGTRYWIVLKESAIPAGGSVIFDSTATGQGTTLYQKSDSTWASDGGQRDTWLVLYAPIGSAIGAFNRDSYGPIQNLPPKNDKRQLDGIYQADGTWAYTCSPLSQPSTITLYPRAVNTANSSSTPAWQYIKFQHDIHVVVRILTASGIVDKSVVLSAGSSSPVSLGPDIALGIVYLAVAKTAQELATPTHGAPPGDRISLRSQ